MHPLNFSLITSSTIKVIKSTKLRLSVTLSENVEYRAEKLALIKVPSYRAGV